MGRLRIPRRARQVNIHSYFDRSGVDILALAAFPTDAEIEGIARSAVEESDSLIALLGLAPSKLHYNAAKSRAPPILPSIGAWYDHDLQSDGDWDDSSGTDSISSARELQELVERAGNTSAPGRTRAQDDKLLKLTCAALALEADEMTKM
jgi:hypothetical protein